MILACQVALGIYALEYKTGLAVLDFDKDGDTERSIAIGSGIPPKVVTVITDSGGVKSLIFVGSPILIPFLRILMQL